MEAEGRNIELPKPGVMSEPANPNKPRLRKRVDEWCCIVAGASNNRMGTGSTPIEAYASWKFWNSSVGEFVAREKWRAKVETLLRLLRENGGE